MVSGPTWNFCQIWELLEKLFYVKRRNFKLKSLKLNFPEENRVKYRETYLKIRGQNISYIIVFASRLIHLG